MIDTSAIGSQNLIEHAPLEQEQGQMDEQTPLAQPTSKQTAQNEPVQQLAPPINEQSSIHEPTPKNTQPTSVNPERFNEQSNFENWLNQDEFIKQYKAQQDKLNAPTKPSEQLGLDPNQGSLTRSAIVAVDSGASDVMTSQADNQGVEISAFRHIPQDGEQDALSAASYQAVQDIPTPAPQSTSFTNQPSDSKQTDKSTDGLAAEPTQPNIPPTTKSLTQEKQLIKDSLPENWDGENIHKNRKAIQTVLDNVSDRSKKPTQIYPKANLAFSSYFIAFCLCDFTQDLHKLHRHF